MSGQRVEVVVYHGSEVYVRAQTENDILPENVPAATRLLMDSLYIRLDDQVSAAKLRAHRRRLRGTRRGRAVGQVLAGSEEEGGRAGGQ